MAEKILKSRNFVNVGIWILLVFDISMKYNIFMDVKDIFFIGGKE